MPVLSALTRLGLAKETTEGTPVNPTAWLPVRNPKPEDVVEWVEDNAFRGVPAETFGLYQGPIYSTYDAEGDFFPDVGGHLLMAILGVDTVTGTSPYQHAFTLLQTSQPPSYTLTDLDGIAQRQYPGNRLTSLELKYADPKGALTWSAKWMGWPSSTTAGPFTPSFPANQPVLGWEFTAQLGGSADTRLMGFTLTLTRKGEPLWTATGTQKPKTVFVAPLKAEVKATFIMEDETELQHLLSADMPALVLTGTQPAGAGGASLMIQMSKLQFRKATRNRSKDYVLLDVEAEAVANTSDAASGVGPVKIVLTNAQSAAY